MGVGQNYKKRYLISFFCKFMNVINFEQFLSFICILYINKLYKNFKITTIPLYTISILAPTSTSHYLRFKTFT